MSSGRLCADVRIGIRKIRARALTIAFALLSLSGLVDTGTAQTVVARGAREIGFDILDVTPSSSFAANITRARAAGASYMILGLGWNQIEPTTPGNCTTPGTYVDPYNGALAALNSYLPSQNLGLTLTISPTSTNIDMRPSNLKSLALDDPLTICRFNMMLDFVFSKIKNIRLVSLQFGNEIDVYPAAYQVSYWSQYWTFFVNVAAKARQAQPGVPVSVIGTLYGAIGASGNPLAQGGLQQIFAYADDVAVTYYPLKSDMTVQSPDVVASDIANLVNLYPGVPILFNEAGYPSGQSGYTKSSSTLQQQFVQQLFTTWDQYAAQIKRINFVRLNDVSTTTANSMAGSYGLSSNKAFVEYLQTLGFRTYSGSDKPAFTTLKTEASSRGW